LDWDWNTAFHRANRVAYGVLRNPELARDVAQEACLKAFVKLESFQGNSSFPAWVRQIAFHLALDRRRSLLPLGPDPDEIPAPNNPEKEASRQEFSRALVDCIEKLTERQQVIFLAKHLDGAKALEIAIELGVKEGTVWATLSQSSDHLRNCLQQHGIGREVLH
jgi:RNA polymerase sigma-70 factor, ECF subfamily